MVVILQYLAPVVLLDLFDLDAKIVVIPLAMIIKIIVITFIVIQ